jgi:hypothetical protein
MRTLLVFNKFNSQLTASEISCQTSERELNTAPSGRHRDGPRPRGAGCGFVMRGTATGPKEKKYLSLFQVDDTPWRRALRELKAWSSHTAEIPPRAEFPPRAPQLLLESKEVRSSRAEFPLQSGRKIRSKFPTKYVKCAM